MLRAERPGRAELTLLDSAELLGEVLVKRRGGHFLLVKAAENAVSFGLDRKGMWTKRTRVTS
jgi:hypothetical protein